MQNNQTKERCWYSAEGLSKLNRQQREGVIVNTTKRGLYIVQWNDNKTPNRLAKRFITTDPLAMLLRNKQKVESGTKPITIDESTWYYKEGGGITLVKEFRDVEGNYLETKQTFISYVQLSDLSKEAILEALNKLTL